MVKALSVSQFNEYLETSLRHDPFLSRVFIAGELANIRYSGNHLYFSLKEDANVIDCVIYYYEDKEIDFDFDLGVEVYVKGTLNLNNYSSRLVIVVSSVKQKGLSEAYLSFIKMKEDFAKRGYFDVKHKKTIAEFPKNVGLITSKDGAAVIDFISVINQIPNDINIKLFPVKVQGSEAVDMIIKGINLLDTVDLDLIVITRGGGSAEDLSVFNDKEIIETVFKTKTPIISAIGHKIDNTLLDLVADLSLQTPTEAGSYVIRNYTNLISEIEKNLSRMREIILNQIRINKLSLDRIKSSVSLYNPKTLVIDRDKDLKVLKSNLDKSIMANIDTQFHKLDLINTRLKSSKLLIENRKKNITITDSKGNQIFSKYSLREGDIITIAFSDGELIAEVNNG